jgi:hypothetical protein
VYSRAVCSLLAEPQSHADFRVVARRQRGKGDEPHAGLMLRESEYAAAIEQLVGTV